MNNTETAIEAFNALRIGFARNLFSFKQSSLFDDLYLHFDAPNDTPRLTYVFFDPDDLESIIAQCVIVFGGWISETEKKWQIGWCVDENFRNTGIGFSIASKALTEFSSKSMFHGDYIEATVDQGNVPSIKISQKLIGSEELLFCESTGLHVHSFLKLIGN